MANPQPAADVVTLCQVELNRLSELLFGTVGELQRDALPASVSGEDIIHVVDRQYDAPARASGFATDLLACVSRLDALVQRLPPPPDEQQQLDRIRQLQRKSQELSEQLEQEKAIAEVKLQQAVDLFSTLASSKLKNRQATKP